MSLPVMLLEQNLNKINVLETLKMEMLPYINLSVCWMRTPPDYMDIADE